MSSEYILRKPWPIFSHDGVDYNLSHLNAYSFSARDSANVDRRIIVTFSDHCFTRPSTGETDSSPLYPDCSRQYGRFCTERFELSLKIREFISFAVGGSVWNSTGDHFVIVRGADYRGEGVDYVIIFSLERITGHSADLHMHVRSAHQRDDAPIETFGSVRFAHLIKLVIERKKPPKNYDRRRKRPS